MKPMRTTSGILLVAFFCAASSSAQQGWEAATKGAVLKADWGTVAEAAQQSKQRFPPALTVLVGDPEQARRIAILVHDRDLPALDRAPAPYDAVLGFRIATDLSSPEAEGRRLSETLNTMMSNSAAQIDAWAEGSGGADPALRSRAGYAGAYTHSANDSD